MKDMEAAEADGYLRLEPESKKSMYIGNLIWFAAASVLFGLLIHYGGPYLPAAGTAGLMAVYIAVMAYLIAGPAVFYRHYRYRITGDEIEIRRGILFLRHQMVPIERVHQVEVSKGPINRAFGLANVNITTAGGTASIQYLKEDVAEGIASKLDECVVKLLKDREQ